MLRDFNRLLALSAISSVAMTVTAASVYAADLGGSLKDDHSAPAIQHSWRGFYIGGHLGAASNGDVTSTYEETGNYEFAGTEKLTDADGFVGGGQLGFNHQIGSIVVGIEAAISGGELDDEISENPPPVGNDYRTKTDVEYLGSIMGRLGFAFDRALIYGKAGYAFTSVDFDATFFNKDGPGGTNGSQVSIGKSFDLDGWAYGGGVEFALTNQISIGVDYTRYDFDSDTSSLAVTNSGISPEVVSSDLEIDVISARLNFKFGG